MHARESGDVESNAGSAAGAGHVQDIEAINHENAMLQEAMQVRPYAEALVVLGLSCQGSICPWSCLLPALVPHSALQTVT